MHAIVVDALGNFADTQARRGVGAALAKPPFTPGLDWRSRTKQRRRGRCSSRHTTSSRWRDASRGVRASSSTRRPAASGRSRRREEFAAVVKAETNGAGVDLILDAIGGSTFEGGFPVLAAFGRYVIYGQASDATATARVDGLHRTNRAILGYSSGHFRRTRPAALAPAVAAAFDLVRTGTIRVIEGGRFPLRDAAAAHRLVESRTSTGRIFLTV